MRDLGTSDAPIPVTVVTGFLGAGKTTLLDVWLREHGPGEVAVIVNEIAALGIDAELLAGRARTIVEITGGCVCCASYEELVRALEDMATSSARPARIFIETSGGASPAGVLRAVSRQDAVALDGVVTLVDASRLDRLAESDLAQEQVGYADVVVLSRADELDGSRLGEARAAVAAQNQAALVVTAERGALSDGASFEALLARRADFSEPLVVTSVHDRGDGPIESVALAVPGELDEERFGDWMEAGVAAVAGRLFRIKGVLAMAGLDARVILQGVGDGVEITFGLPWADAPRGSRLVIVGFGLDRDALAAGFAACAA